MHSENDTPALMRALDAVSFEADLAVQELLDLDRVSVL
jgi:hypothetical protein